MAMYANGNESPTLRTYVSDETKVSFLNVSTFKSAQVPWTYFFKLVNFSGFRSTNNATPKEQIQPQQSESENIISSASQSADLFEHEATTSGLQDVTSQYVRKPDVHGKGQQQQSVTQEPKENRDNSRPSQTTGNIEMIEQLKYVR